MNNSLNVIEKKEFKKETKAFSSEKPWKKIDSRKKNINLSSKNIQLGKTLKKISKFSKENSLKRGKITSVNTKSLNLKDRIKGKISKTKQEEIYFRQRSIKAIQAKEKQLKKKKRKHLKRSLRFFFFLKKEQKKQTLQIKITFRKSFSYKNITFLIPFLTRYGKIQSRRVTRLKVFQQARISKLIRRARASKLIPLHFSIIS